MIFHVFPVVVTLENSVVPFVDITCVDADRLAGFEGSFVWRRQLKRLQRFGAL